MKKVLILLAICLAAMMLANGCGDKADAKVTCEGCGLEVPGAMAKEVDGKKMCQACVVVATAEKEAAALGDKAKEVGDKVKEVGEEIKGAVIECAGGCGMKMAKVAATEVEGKFYCKGCAAHVGHDHK